MDQVRAKVAEIQENSLRERADLNSDPIKVIRGPKDRLYIIDHHHTANAWRLAGRPFAVCEIETRPPFETDDQFWSGLITDHLVRLADENGKPLAPADLPSSLQIMHDDPYRSLAGLVRNQGGFCKSEMKQVEFAEFVWADWFRGRPELPLSRVRASAKKMTEPALALAHSPEAKDVDGYVGDKPPGFQCRR
jgi:hypothetical protein